MQTQQTARKQSYEFDKSAELIFKSVSTYMLGVSIFMFLIGGLEGIAQTLISLNQKDWAFVLFWIVELLTYIVIGYFTIKTSKSFGKIVRDKNDSRNLKSALRQMRNLYQIERWVIQLNIVVLVLFPVVDLIKRLIAGNPNR